MRANVYGGRTPWVRIGERANVNTFFEDVIARFSAFAFIGHAEQITDPVTGITFSVGLQVNPSVNPPDPRRFINILPPFAVTPGQTGPTEGPVYCDKVGGDLRCDLTAQALPPIPFGAKILFFGECTVSDLFMSLWGMSNTQTHDGPALIVPKNPQESTLLMGAAMAWKPIAIRLLAGMKVGPAVQEVNDILAGSEPESGQVFPPFKVVGNVDAALK